MVTGRDVPTPPNPSEPNESSYMLRDKKTSSQEYRTVAPDGDWGWYVVSGCAFVNFLLPGMLRSFGPDVLDEFAKMYEFDHKLTSRWIPATFDLMFYTAGALSCLLCKLTSHRTVTLWGGLLAFVGMITSSLANSVPYLYISYGIMVGFGAGMCYPAGILLVNEYFDKYRGLANGLSLVGTTVGSLALPTYLKFLTSSYGYRGGILIASGMMLNVLACALAYEPSEKYVRTVAGTTASSSLSSSTVSVRSRASVKATVADEHCASAQPGLAAAAINCDCGGGGDDDSWPRTVATSGWRARVFGGKTTVRFAAVFAVSAAGHLAFATLATAAPPPPHWHAVDAVRLAAADAAGRVLIPTVSDMLSSRGTASVYLYAAAAAVGGAAMLTTGAALTVQPHRLSPSSSACLLVASALASGAAVGLEPLVAVRALGRRRLATTFSAALLGKGVAQLAVHLLFGSTPAVAATVAGHCCSQRAVPASVALCALGTCLVAAAAAGTAAFVFKSHYAAKNAVGRYVRTA